MHAPEGALNALAGLMLVILVVLVINAKSRWKPDRSAHGTARFADEYDLAPLKHSRMVVGRSANGDLVSLPKSAVHLATFASTGAGKTGCLIAGHMLTYGGPLVAIDPKGELFAITHRYRQKLGPVAVLDPFGVTGDGPHRVSFNPLDAIKPGLESLDACRAMAASIVVMTGRETEIHWPARAETVVTGSLAVVANHCHGKERTLASVRDLIAGGFDGMVQTLIGMGGPFARMGGGMKVMESKELAGVLSTADRETNFLDSPAVASCLGESTYSLDTLREKNGTLHIVLPPAQLVAQSRFLRLIVSSIVRHVAESEPSDLLMILEEAAQLGNMPAIEQALTLLRYKKIKCHFYYQSLGQLKSCFAEKEQVLLDNVDAQIFMGVNSLEMAERVSKMCGSFTKVTESLSNQNSRSWQEQLGESGVNVSESSSVSTSSHARELLTAAEVLRLSPECVVAFMKGYPPALLRRVSWWKEPFLKRRAS